MIRDLPCRACRRRVLDAAAGDAQGRVSAVMQLDEIVLVRGPCVTAAAVDLADDDVRSAKNGLTEGKTRSQHDGKADFQPFDTTLLLRRGRISRRSHLVICDCG